VNAICPAGADALHGRDDIAAARRTHDVERL
jgi:hypothetical protein